MQFPECLLSLKELFVRCLPHCVKRFTYSLELAPLGLQPPPSSGPALHKLYKCVCVCVCLPLCYTNVTNPSALALSSTTLGGNILVLLVITLKIIKCTRKLTFLHLHKSRPIEQYLTDCYALSIISHALLLPCPQVFVVSVWGYRSSPFLRQFLML